MEKPYDFMRMDQVEEVFFDKNISKNFKRFDIIEDSSLKSWILFKIDDDKNSIKLLKFPVLKFNELVVLKLDKKEIVALIKRVYRRETNKKEEE